MIMEYNFYWINGDYWWLLSWWLMVITVKVIKSTIAWINGYGSLNSIHGVLMGIISWLSWLSWEYDEILYCDRKVTSADCIKSWCRLWDGRFARHFSSLPWWISITARGEWLVVQEPSWNIWVRQWEGLIIPYMKWKNQQKSSKPPSKWCFCLNKGPTNIQQIWINMCKEKETCLNPRSGRIQGDWKISGYAMHVRQRSQNHTGYCCSKINPQLPSFNSFVVFNQSLREKNTQQQGINGWGLNVIDINIHKQYINNT